MRSKVLDIFRELYEVSISSFFNRSIAAIYLFDLLDRLKKLNFPNNWISILEQENDQLIQTLNLFDTGFDTQGNQLSISEKVDSFDEVHVKTGKIYFQLWKNFKEDEYYHQPTILLTERFDKNGIRLTGIKRALDSGCGSGRYTLAIKKCGCQHVTGVDISADSIAFAKLKNSFHQNGVSYLASSVLELPFPDESFDFVFSNGVLHHTSDPQRGLNEINRVLMPGGYCWLYLYGGKESFFWDVVDCCRKILAPVPQSYTQTVMRMLGYPPGRIFHRIDFFYVPINHRYFNHEVKKMIINAGFKNYRRLLRGATFDWDEIKHHYPNIDPYIYGEGENRWFLQK